MGDRIGCRGGMEKRGLPQGLGVAVIRDPGQWVSLPEAGGRSGRGGEGGRVGSGNRLGGTGREGEGSVGGRVSSAVLGVPGREGR